MQEMNYNLPAADAFMSAFENIKEYTADGVEFWRASNLMTLFNYSQWQQFYPVILKSMDNFSGIITELMNKVGIGYRSSGDQSNDSCASMSHSGGMFNTTLHYVSITRSTYSGAGNKAVREYPDFMLTRLACYAIAMEADNRKTEVKLAKQYMLMSILENEKRRQQAANVMRIGYREDMKKYENSLETTYADHGVPSKHFGIVKSAGDKGFYDNPGGTSAVKRELGIPNNATLADYMPFETMTYKAMANINTKYGIIRNDLHGTDECASEAFNQNQRQRNEMINTTGMAPEDTMPIQRISDAKKEVKAINKQVVNAALEAKLPNNVDPRIYNLMFTIAGAAYDLNTWCYINQVDPMFILGLIDQGVPFDQAIFMRPSGGLSPILQY